MLMQKNNNAVGFAVLVVLSITSGCATNPNQSRNSWANCGFGALMGAVLGAAIGAATGGGKGAAIGTVVGAGTGCVAGYALSEYLDPQEKHQYDASLSQNMNRMPANANGSTSWQSADRSKAVQTSFGGSSSLNQATANSGLNIDQTVVARLPAGAMCRPTTRTFSVNGKSVSDNGVSCRDANGDWVDVTSKTTA